jgi:hypothetical protein
MGIRQQKRPFAPQPQVQSTDYGAQYVKAATETPANEVKVEEPVKEEEPVAETPVVDAPAPEVKNEEPAKPDPARKGRGGRPKKKQ